MDKTDMDLGDQHEIQAASLKALFSERSRQMGRLPEKEFDLYLNASSRSNHSDDASSTIQEFKKLMRPDHPELDLQFGFVYDWATSAKQAYDICWWINEWPFGVYFIYDVDRVLKYVGSSWESKGIGKRIWSKDHEEWRHSCDVVLFPKEIGYLALAYECYAVARLSEMKSGRVNLLNDKFTKLRFPCTCELVKGN